MKKILFLIHDLGQGGAEKVLVNLVNNMDPQKFDITLMALFGGGVNEQFLKPHIKYKTIWKRTFIGNTHILKLLTPKQLHRLCVKGHYDIEVSYLEGISARIVSGCSTPNTDLYCWIHSNSFSLKEYSRSFRSPKESTDCYNRFNRIVCVSEFTKDNFIKCYPSRKNHTLVLYNTVEYDSILAQSMEPVNEFVNDGLIRLIAVGSLKAVKGFDRILRIMKRLQEESIYAHLYILGRGPLKKQMESYIANNNLEHVVTLLGYKTNPYKYVQKADLFVCSSYSEGFSTATTEALIVGTPVCTVEVSGMREMLGNHNEYGVVVENNDEALYRGIKDLILNVDRLKKYQVLAKKRGTHFSVTQTVSGVEQLFLKSHIMNENHW